MSCSGTVSSLSNELPGSCAESHLRHCMEWTTCTAGVRTEQQGPLLTRLTSLSTKIDRMAASMIDTKCRLGLIRNPDSRGFCWKLTNLSYLHRDGDHRVPRLSRRSGAVVGVADYSLPVWVHTVIGNHGYRARDCILSRGRRWQAWPPRPIYHAGHRACAVGLACLSRLNRLGWMGPHVQGESRILQW